MQPADILVNSKALLLRISVITGWVNPEGPMLNILVDQFSKKLAESYKNVNADEVEYAFRTYGTTVKDWGKQMNLSLIDEVMITYLQSRKEISAKEEQKALLGTPEPNVELSDEEMADWLAFTADRVKGQRFILEMIPIPIYEWLDRNGRILASAEVKRGYLEMAVVYRHGRLMELAETDISARSLFLEFSRMKQAGEFKGAHIDNLKDIAKKMILWDMILKNKL